MPLSVNRMYSSNGFGGKTLSTAGKAWKARAKVSLVKQWVSVPKGVFVDNTPYELHLVLRFTGMVNKGWPKRSKRRYKKKDISNYVKLLEDTISEVTGIDDSQTTRLIVEKVEMSGFPPGTPCVQILYRPLE